MFRRQRNLIGLFLPLALVGFSIFASAAFAQKVREAFVYAPPSLSLSSDQAVINACEGETVVSTVRLNARATSLSGNPIRYRWTTSAGRINGDGPTVSWDLSGVKPGYYKASLQIATSSGDEACEAFASTAVLVKCPPPPPPACPNLYINCPEKIELNQPLTFTSTIPGSFGNVAPTYNWSISAGRIIEGQGTPSIKVDTTGLAGQTLKATLSMGGYNLDCSASCAVQLPITLRCRKFDEYPEIARNDEKARLDNFAIELQSDPSSTAYVIIHPGQRSRGGEVQTRKTRIVDYLVNTRALNAGRIVTLIGPPRSNMMVELWACPQGATPPTPTP